jgi:DNA modification methylase
MNLLIHGDCLDAMRTMPAQSVDLCYMDPPFFSNAQYEKIWNDRGETASFNDRWRGGIEHYIAWLAERVSQIHRLLKPSGSIFLHCDWHANYRIRLQVLDEIFGAKNFRNEIIWCYNGPANVSFVFPNKHDTIYRYSMSDEFIFNKDDIRVDYSDATLKRRQYAETQKKGIPFKGKPTEEYLRGRVPFDWWADIPSGGQMSAAERVGYPTQKPLLLAQRIIKAASLKGQMVLDPFMGGGTTMVAADMLGRGYIGIDASAAAVRIAEMRLRKHYDMLSAPFMVMLHKYDEETLKAMPPHAFADFICQHAGGSSNPKKIGDRGIDGWDSNGIPIQVKQSKSVGRGVVAQFATDARSNNPALFDKNVAEKKSVGTIVAFSFSRGAYEEIAALQNHQHITITPMRVDELIGIAGKPPLEVSFTWEEIEGKPDCKRIHFAAAAQEVEGRHIVNYAYDFHYDKFRKYESIIGAGGEQDEGNDNSLKISTFDIKLHSCFLLT